MTVDDLRFEVRRSENRRTVQVTVDRQGELILSAPAACAPSVMERFVRDKRFWIYTKLAEKEALQPAVAEKEYVSGEGFSYLGRSHRLLLVASQNVPVKLEAGRFKMRRADAPKGREHMIRWYTDHAQPWLARRVGGYAGRVRVKPSDVIVQDLGYRWGSCGKGEKLYFHWKTILLPPRIVEYIVVHELVHLHEVHHTPEFWRRVERAMPDFAARKLWLAENAQVITAV
ncbi:MAG: M48 family metallopeptidase [Proteobacteria bacterium]|nr:M48 family metallopeptidase [Pseudomonadota bacterium]